MIEGDALTEMLTGAHVMQSLAGTPGARVMDEVMKGMGIQPAEMPLPPPSTQTWLPFLRGHSPS
jgi:hypothetical protein